MYYKYFKFRPLNVSLLPLKPFKLLNFQLFGAWSVKFSTSTFNTRLIWHLCVYSDIKWPKKFRPLSLEKTWGNHAVQFYSGSLWPPKRLLFFLRVWMPRLLGDFRGIPAGLSLRLFVLGTRSVWVLFLFLFSRPECWWRPASQVAHTSKQEGSRLLVFRQTSLTFFVVWGTGGGRGARRFISRGSPPLSPSTSPLPHPTGAAKSKCQSRRRRCIPSKGQLVVATEGSVARLSQNTGELFKNLLFDIVQSGYRFISLVQNQNGSRSFFFLHLKPLFAMTPLFWRDRPCPLHLPTTHSQV